MDNIYETILSNNIYLAIAGLLLAVIVFSIIKKLFKVALIVLLCFVLWVGYIMVTEDKGLDEALEDALKTGQEGIEVGGKKIEGALKKVKEVLEGEKMIEDALDSIP